MSNKKDNAQSRYFKSAKGKASQRKYRDKEETKEKRREYDRKRDRAEYMREYRKRKKEQFDDQGDAYYFRCFLAINGFSKKNH